MKKKQDREAANTFFDGMSSLELAGAESKIKQAIALKQEHETRKKTQDWQRSAYIYFRGSGARGKSNREMAKEVFKVLKDLWGKDSVVQMTNGKRGHMQPQKGVDISITAHGAVTLHRSATEKYTQKLSLAKLIEKLKADYNYDNKPAEPVKTMPKVGRTGKIFIRGNPRNFATASEIRMTLMRLWGVPESNIDIISGNHGHKPSTANVEVTVKGDGVIYLHQSSDFSAVRTSRADLMVMLGYAYGQPQKQVKTTESGAMIFPPGQPPEPPKTAKPQEAAKRALIIVGETEAAKARAKRLADALEAEGYTTFILDNKVSGTIHDIVISCYDLSSSVYVHGPHRLSGQYAACGVSTLIEKIKELSKKPVAKTQIDPVVVEKAASAGIPAGPLTTNKPKKPLTVRLFSTYIGTHRDNVVAMFRSEYDGQEIEFSFDRLWWSGNKEDFVGTLCSDFIIIHKEFDKEYEPARQVMLVDLPKYLRSVHKPNESAEIDYAKLPESRYVYLVNSPYEVSESVRRVLSKAVYNMTGEYPSNVFSTSTMHEDTKVIISVYDEKIVNVRLNVVPAKGHNVYYDEVAAKVKKLLDESGVPYAKAEKRAPKVEEPTKQYVYVRRRQGKLPDGQAFSLSVAMAVTKKQKEKLVELAGDKPVGTFLREHTLKSLKID